MEWRTGSWRGGLGDPLVDPDWSRGNASRCFYTYSSLRQLPVNATPCLIRLPRLLSLTPCALRLPHSPRSPTPPISQLAIAQIRLSLPQDANPAHVVQFCHGAPDCDLTYPDPTSAITRVVFERTWSPSHTRCYASCPVTQSCAEQDICAFPPLISKIVPVWYPGTASPVPLSLSPTS